MVLVGSEKRGIFKQAIKYCTEAGLSRQVSEELKKLKNADIIGPYESFVRSTPWNWHPATLVLKEIYPFFVVFFSSACYALD